MLDHADQIEAVLAFKSERVTRAVERVEPVDDVPGAKALSTDSLSSVWELNLLLGPPRLGAGGMAALFEACEELQRANGLAHRKIRLMDANDGDEGALAAYARRLGWRMDRDLVMVRRRPPDRLSGEPRVQALDVASVAQASDEFLSQEPLGRDPDVRRQLVAQYERWEASAANARRVGVVEDDRVVAWCRLYEDGGITEIDDVSVLHARRGEGLGRALMEGALAAVADDQLLFLCADPQDWPQQLYRRLGFDVAGQRIGATRIT